MEIPNPANPFINAAQWGAGKGGRGRYLDRIAAPGAGYEMAGAVSPRATR